MVNEKEDHYEEEGEYHFSDDQVNYDVEPETTKTSSSSPFTKESLLAKFNHHRKGILGLASMVVLIAVVYKILVPASTTPSTEFNEAAVTAKTEAAKPKVTKTKNSPAPQVITAPASSSPHVMQPVTPPAAPQSLGMAAPVPPANPIPAAMAPSMPANSPINAPQPSSTEANGSVNAIPTGPTLMQPMAAQANTTQASTMDAQAKERMIALEQQTAAMMNLLQTEYAQKIADTETQTNVMRGKMEELTKRINHMETSLNQITQLLQGANKTQASGVIGSNAYANAPARAEPRMIYSVQAIIPGRAWLKSESGDTVTVAEGDYLKGYGRVTKIDPYDGIVAIDTGSKIINLSYGIGGD